MFIRMKRYFFRFDILYSYKNVPHIKNSAYDINTFWFKIIL